MKGTNRFTLLLLSSLIFPLIFAAITKLQAQDFISEFDYLHNTLKQNYAFSEWKGIDWANLYTEFQSKIADAQTKNDSAQFYLNIREYLSNIPDGHISLNGWMDKFGMLMSEQIGGSYGFSLLKLDDGKIKIRLVTENSPAAQAGIKFGAEVISFDNVDINDALENTSVLWANPIPATNEGKLLNQMRFLGRAKVGDTAIIKYINPGDSETKEAQLTAVEDDFETLQLTDLGCSTTDTTKVHFKILNPSGYGYLQLTSCGEGEESFKIYTEFRDAIKYFLDNEIKGLVLDLRINEGGDDWLAAAVSSFFYSDTTLYEYVSAYDSATDQFQIYQALMSHLNSQTMELYTNENYPLGAIFIEPPEFNFNKPVVVINSNRQISSGEGVAMALQKLPNCKVTSLYGSNGSFGVVLDDNAIVLFANSNPLVINYPSGRSLDADENIQVDSDQNMIGGVIPDERPALDDNAINEIFINGNDYELDFAVEKLNTLVSTREQDQNLLSTSFKLHQNFPNPFNPSTTIQYEILKPENVKINIYDLTGSLVKELVNEPKNAGKFYAVWDGRDNYGKHVASGPYFYQLISGKFIQIKKMILLK